MHNCRVYALLRDASQAWAQPLEVGGRGDVHTKRSARLAAWRDAASDADYASHVTTIVRSRRAACIYTESFHYFLPRLGSVAYTRRDLKYYVGAIRIRHPSAVAVFSNGTANAV